MKRGWFIGSFMALWVPLVAVAKTTGTEDLLNQQNKPWQPLSPAIQTPLWPKGLKIAPPATPSR